MKKFFICFKSGHFKQFVGEWKGDAIWMHFIDEKGNNLHINKEEVEYVSSHTVEAEEDK